MTHKPESQNATILEKLAAKDELRRAIIHARRTLTANEVLRVLAECPEEPNSVPHSPSSSRSV
jgi:hypothetical protein